MRATFTGVTTVRDALANGVMLDFRPERTRLEVDVIEDFAELGPSLDLPVIDGLGKVLRILRAARIAAPDGAELIDRPDHAADLLRRAIGTLLYLEVRPRNRMRFIAWTDSGVETVDDVVDVVEEADAYLVMRKKGRFPVRLPREDVVRQQTESERWYEITSIERA